ncbi:hypothetical protein JKP88DRAFT_199922, partial [Tribonema minus]
MRRPAAFVVCVLCATPASAFVPASGSAAARVLALYSRPSEACVRRWSCLRFGLSGELSDSSGGGESSPQSSAADLASIVERSFVVACSEGDYTRGLQAFISAIMKAYESGFAVPTLSMEIGMCGNNSAGRPLMAEEVELRTVWMTLVYLTLERARWPQRVPRAAGISAPFKNEFDPFVGNIMRAHSSGYDLNRLKLEEMMRGGTEPRTPFEA